ncbi:ParB/RepB/Spo0J family partition protein [Streptomyces sp. NPDC060194]|uniref:ParB/RepB/Spo0J family partition protein n=1 Tax=Streptomyces sp. NPDC060194 TaxID=3347069 RepID=UPI003650A7D7
MSSKADKLRASASFARAQPVSSRRAAIAAATGVATEGVAPPTEAPIDTLAHNPLNFREELTGIEETAESLKVRGQLQPLAVVNRGAFLRAHPEQQEAVGQARFVVIDGNRRLAASRLAGLTTLLIHVNDALAASSQDILEASIIANIHRVDVPPMDQAKAIQSLVAVHGSQGQVAKRLGKTPAWVSQRLALLELVPELQEKVETGELRVESARRIGRLPAEQQESEARRTLAEPKPARKARPTPVETAPARPAPEAEPRDTAPAPAPAPEPAHVPAQPTSPDTLWDDPQRLAREIISRLDHAQRRKVISLLLRANETPE